MPRVPQLSHQQLLETDYIYRSINALMKGDGIDNDTQAMMGLALQERAQALGLLGCPEGFPYDWLEAKVGEATAEIQPQTLLLSKHVESLANSWASSIADIADMVMSGLTEEQQAEFRALFTPPVVVKDQGVEDAKLELRSAKSLCGWAVQCRADDGSTEWLKVPVDGAEHEWTRDPFEAAIFVGADREEVEAEFPEDEVVCWPNGSDFIDTSDSDKKTEE